MNNKIIYTIYLFHYEFDYKILAYRTKSHRTVGFFFDIKKAENAILNNAGDMFECDFNYAMIEKLNEGIYPHSEVIKCYKAERNAINYDIELICECENPYSDQICNFSIG
jgi:hypothetical protein